MSGFPTTRTNRRNTRVTINNNGFTMKGNNRKTKQSTRYTRKVKNTENIGTRNYSFIKNNNPNAITFHEYRAINFTCDVLQYLINKQLFTIKVENTKDGKPPTFGLCVKDEKIPLIFDIKLEKIKTPGLIVNIKYDNLFESLRIITKNNTTKSKYELLKSFKEKLSKNSILTFEDYQLAVELMRDYYHNLKINQDNGNYEKINKWDISNTLNVSVMPLSCSTDYGDAVNKFKPENRGFMHDDFIFATGLGNDIIDLVKKHFNDSYVPKHKNTYYLDNDGNIYPKVIHKEVSFIDVDKVDKVTGNPIKSGENFKTYLIIGTDKYFLHMLANGEFTNLPDYNNILEDQRQNYESWVREYTYQEINPDLKNPIKSRSDINFGDYVTNKKKLAGVDYKYIDTMNAGTGNAFLPESDYEKLKQYVAWKANKMCENKFNKPNVSLQYIWDIMEITFLNSDKTDILSIKPAINTIRELNANHTRLLKEIQRLSWNEMLVLNNIIISDRPEDVDYKQVFTEINLAYSFRLISSYIHPLNYKTNYYFKENKIITLEELIECSSLTCDGLYPGMEKYRGLPFYAVVPIEFTNQAYILNSILYFQHFKCNSYPSSVSGVSTNNSLKMTKKRSNNSNNSERYVLNRTVILKATMNDKGQYEHIELENNNQTKIDYLTNLFINPNMKVYSNLIAPNGLLFMILYNGDPNP